MFWMIHKRLTFANVAMTLALVFAMSGGAYAAKKYVITSTKQIKPSVLAQLKGKAGANGANGATGPAGPQGSVGSAGKEGTPGKEGAPGTNGKDGVSVTSKALTPSDVACKKEGGSEFTAASGKTVACNGSPWVAGGVLPSGASEMGEWSYVDSKAVAGEKTTPISFVIPLKTNAVAHFIGIEELAGGKEESPAIKEGKCKGTPSAPEAAAGQLCVFTTLAFGLVGKASFFDMQTGTVSAEAAGTVGTLLYFKVEVGEDLIGGTWVVTGN
jgi:hypothetical protein